MRPLLVALLALALAACAAKGKPTPTKPAPAAAKPTPAQAAGPDKGDPDARFKEALQLLQDKKPQEAKDAFAKLAQDFPAMSGPLTNLGILYAQGRQRDQALAAFNKAVADNPQNAVAQNWLGILYRESGDYARAEGAYQRAIKAKPDAPAPHLNLGILYDAYLHRPQDALAQYREYQRLSNGDKLIVAAWIKELEESGAPPRTTEPAVAPARPAAPKPVEQTR